MKKALIIILMATIAGASAPETPLSPKALPVPDNTPVQSPKQTPKRLTKKRSSKSHNFNQALWPSEHGAYLAWKRAKGWIK